MKITYLPTLIPTLKNKHLLLDTNIFRDASSKPTDFVLFFNELKKADITLTTIDFVKYELLKGSLDTAKYQAKEKFISDIIDVIIPISPGILNLVYELIKLYKIDGTSLGITDLILGAILMQYKSNIYLITRDTSDFIQDVFELSFIVNASYKKGIFTYGIYNYAR